MQNLTEIQIAANHGNWRTVIAIAEAKMTDAQDSLCYGSALLTAVYCNRKIAAVTLLKANASLRWQYNETGNTALHCAVIDNDIEMVKLLIQYGADLSIKNKKGQTPVLIAVDNQDWPMVIAIANAKETDEEDNLYYRLALLTAVYRRQRNAFEALLKAKAPLVCQYFDTGNTPLHTAVINKDIEIVKLLIRYGADLSIKNNKGLTPAKLAGDNQDWLMVIAIANAKKTDEQDSLCYGSALLLAVYFNQKKVVKALLNANASTKWCMTSTNESPLHLALKNNNPELVKLLILHGSDLSAENNDGERPEDIIALRSNANSQEREDYQKLCFEIGLYYFNSDFVSDYASALLFFILSGNSCQSERLKATCLLGLSEIFGSLAQTQLSLSELLTKENPINHQPILIDEESINLLIANLMTYANDNDEINNFLGELYYYMGSYEEAFKCWKAARKTSKQATAHIQTTLKNKIKAEHPIAELLEIEILHIEMENNNENISAIARVKLFEYYFKKEDLKKAKKYATTTSLKEILFNHYFGKDKYKEAGEFAITRDNQLKLSEIYLSKGMYRKAARLAFLQTKINALSDLEKTLLLIPEVRMIVNQAYIIEIIVEYQDDAEFVSPALLKQLIEEDKCEINQTILAILKNKSLLAKIEASLAIAYFCDSAYSNKLTLQDGKNFLIYFIEHHPEFSLDSVIYEDIQNKLTTDFDESERSRFLKAVAIQLNHSKIVPNELENLRLIIGEGYFKKIFTEFVKLPSVQQKTEANDSLTVKSIYAHILLNSNNPDYSVFMKIFSEHNPEVDELYPLYELIDSNKFISISAQYEWKGILKRFAMKVVNEKINIFPVDKKIQEYEKAAQKNLFSDNRHSYLNVINHKTNAVIHLEALKSAHELDCFSEREKTRVLQQITQNYSPSFFSSTESKELFNKLKDSQVKSDAKIQKISAYLTKENNTDGKLINQNEKLFDVIKSNVATLSSSSRRSLPG